MQSPNRLVLSFQKPTPDLDLETSTFRAQQGAAAILTLSVRDGAEKGIRW